MTSTGHSLPPTAIWHQNGEDVMLELAGDWRRDGPAVVVTGAVPDRCASHYQAEGLGTCDSTLPAFLLAHLRAIATPDAAALPPMDGLPDNLRGLLELALAVPEENATQTTPRAPSELRKLGKLSLKI
jgi:phospholipid/cholesterol/gamma-HCH transport system permease protein